MKKGQKNQYLVIFRSVFAIFQHEGVFQSLRSSLTTRIAFRFCTCMQKTRKFQRPVFSNSFRIGKNSYIEYQHGRKKKSFKSEKKVPETTFLKSARPNLRERIP